jgi:hypothetical protein
MSIPLSPQRPLRDAFAADRELGLGRFDIRQQNMDSVLNDGVFAVKRNRQTGISATCRKWMAG